MTCPFPTPTSSGHTRAAAHLCRLARQLGGCDPGEADGGMNHQLTRQAAANWIAAATTPRTVAAHSHSKHPAMAHTTDSTTGDPADPGNLGAGGYGNF